MSGIIPDRFQPASHGVELKVYNHNLVKLMSIAEFCPAAGIVRDIFPNKARVGEKSEQLARILLVYERKAWSEELHQGLRTAGIEVVGDVQNFDAAHALFSAHDPDVVLMEITMPGSPGLEALRRMLLHRRTARILVVSAQQDAISVMRVLQAGAFGYITQAAAPEETVEAIRWATAGKKFLSAEIARTLALRDFGTQVDDLSERELEILRLLASGYSVKQIAHSIGLTVKTVGNHQTALKRKFEAETLIEVLRKAWAAGLLARLP